MPESVSYLADDGCASENTNKPVENHERPIDIIGWFRILSDFCGSFHGKVKTAQISVIF